MTDITKFSAKKHKEVMGSTMIIHGARTKLGLSMVEYAIAKLCEYCAIYKRALDTVRIYRHLGVEEEEGIVAVKTLRTKKIITWAEGNKSIPIMSKAWKDIHAEILDERFELFWAKKLGKRFTGSKSQSKLLFNQLLEKDNVEFSYIMAQKNAYFKFLAHPDNLWRNVMGGPVFLNRSTRRYQEPWNEYFQDLKKPKVEMAKGVESTTTMNDKNKLFSKNS